MFTRDTTGNVSGPGPCPDHQRPPPTRHPRDSDRPGRRQRHRHDARADVDQPHRPRPSRSDRASGPGCAAPSDRDRRHPSHRRLPHGHHRHGHRPNRRHPLRLRGVHQGHNRQRVGRGDADDHDRPASDTTPPATPTGVYATPGERSGRPSLGPSPRH